MTQFLTLPEISRRVQLELLKLADTEYERPRGQEKFCLTSDPLSPENKKQWDKAFQYFASQEYNKYGNKVDRSSMKRWL